MYTFWHQPEKEKGDGEKVKQNQEDCSLGRFCLHYGFLCLVCKFHALLGFMFLYRYQKVEGDHEE